MNKNQSEALRKHEKLLKQIEEDRVFSIFRQEGGFYIAEECDMWFSHRLTKKECMELSELFKEMVEEYENN